MGLVKGNSDLKGKIFKDPTSLLGTLFREYFKIIGGKFNVAFNERAVRLKRGKKEISLRIPRYFRLVVATRHHGSERVGPWMKDG